MRLFQKTLLLFITVIILQSLVTISFITRSIGKTQSVDAWRELAREASSVYDNFNYWKLSLWRQINLLKEDEELKPLVHEGGGISFGNEFVAKIKQAAAGSAVEFVVLKRVNPRHNRIIPVVGTTQAFLGAEGFTNRKDHPYIEMVLLEGTLYFTGVVRIMENTPPGEGSSIDVFLVKQIDHNLLEKLSSNQRIKILLSTTGGYSLGTIPLEGLPERVFGRVRDNSYITADSLEIRGMPYSAVIQHSGTVRTGNSEDLLSLTVFLSRVDYQRQLTTINRAILTISLISAVTTILLSLLFSNNITSPIRRLVGAMDRIQGGEYNVSIRSSMKGEIGELLTGFNAMAGQLSLDKKALEKHIHEIVQLKEYSDKIINAIREGLVVINEDFTIEKTNQSFLELFGLAEKKTIGFPLSSLPIGIVDEPLIRDIGAIVAGKKSSFSVLRRVPGRHAYEIKLYPLYGGFGNDNIHCIMIVENISTRIEYEEKIFQAEKLASISMLSAGMAHEINNPLSSILTNTQNMIEEEKDGSKAETLRLIELETKRIAGIVRELLDFASSGGKDSSCTDVNGTIGEVTRLLGYSLKKDGGISLRNRFDSACPAAVISDDELKQVIINLVKNSLQAMDGSGTVTVGTLYDAERGRILITVEDEGMGIPPDQLQRIFDPFFTTKSGHDGTGLGLSVVYGIVTKHRGTISVDSKPGKGTSVCLEIPAV